MSAPPSPVPPRHLALVGALRTFSERSDHAAELAGRGLGLSRTDLRALAVLMRRAEAGQETTVTDLGRGLHLTKAAATAAVDRLVASGHARRRRSDRDRRRVIVDHTPSAIADGRAAFLPLASRIGAALEGFDDAELAAALAVVRAAAAALEDDADPGESPVPGMAPDPGTAPVAGGTGPADPATPVRPVLIGVDGRSGSGKSTLAAALAARLRPHTSVAVLEVESVYPGWDGLAAALAPEGPYARAVHDLRAGRPARLRSWDWRRDAPGEELTVPAAAVVVCEGVGALCAAARDALDLRVWAELDEATRRTRALARDGAAYAPHWERWAAQEERYLAAEDPAAAADLRVTLD